MTNFRLILPLLVAFFACSAGWCAQKVSLQEALRLMLSNNSDIQTAEHHARAAKFQLEAAWSDLLPTFNLNQNWTGSESSLSTDPAGLSYPFRRDFQGLSYGYTISIFDGGAAVAAIHRAQASKRQAQQSKTALENAKALSLVQAYTSLWFALGQKMILSKIGDLLETLRLASLDSDTSKPNPVLAEIQVAQTQNRAQSRSVRRAVMNAQRAFYNVVGVEAPNDISDLLADSEVIEILEIPDRKVLDDSRLENTPTMRMAHSQYGIARANADAEIAEGLPKLYFGQTWIRNDRTLRQSGLDWVNKVDSTSLSLAFVFKFGAAPERAAAEERAKAAKSSIESSLRNLKLQLDQVYSQIEFLDEDQADQLKSIRISLSSVSKSLKAVEEGKPVNLLAVKGNLSGLGGLVQGWCGMNQQEITSRAQILASLGELVAALENSRNGSASGKPEGLLDLIGGAL